MTNIDKYKEKLRVLRELSPSLIENKICFEDKIKHLDELLDDKIKNFKPKMMVYGVYNSGKSTVINALVGKEVAKTGDTPETKEINKYPYKEYEIFDTPGINAPADDEKITEDYYKQCELILFVMSNENVEKEFIYKKIKKILDDNKKAVVILNKKQDCTEEDEAIIIDKIYENIAKIGFGKENVKDKISVYSVNALSAFNGKTQNKALLYQNSGFEALETRIERLFSDSSEADIIRLCNGNIETFVEEIKHTIDEKIENVALQLTQHFISDTQSAKKATFEDLRSLVNKELETLKNDLLARGGEDTSVINDAIEAKINELKTKLEERLQEKIGDFKDRIQNLNYDLDKIELDDTEGSDVTDETKFTKENIEKWVKKIDEVALIIAARWPQAAPIVAILTTAIKTIADIISIFKDDTEERNRQERANQMKIANAVRDVIDKIQKEFYQVIEKQVNEIYNPIIEQKINEKNAHENNKNTLINIKNQIIALGQNLPFV